MMSFWSPKWRYFGHFHQKWPILTKLTPLMTFLTKFMSINLTEIIFRNFYGKIYLTTLPKSWHLTSFWRPKYTKITRFWHFHQKWPILTKLTPLMKFLTKYMSINLNEIILKTFGKIFLNQFPQILIYDVIFAPKMTKFWPFSPKLT